MHSVVPNTVDAEGDEVEVEELSPRRQALRLSPRKSPRKAANAPAKWEVTEGDAGADEGGAGRKDGGGREVEVAYQIFRVDNIDTVGQTFFAEFKIFARWYDPELIGADPSAVDFSAPERWNPAITVLNGVEVEEKYERIRLRDPATGRVHRTVVYSGTLHEHYELESFPFDYQELGIRVSSRQHMGKVVFIPHTHRDCTMARFELPEWSVSHHMSQLLSSDPERSFTGAAFSELRVVTVVRRKSSYFTLNIMLLAFLLTSSSFATAAIALDSLGDRYSIVLTLLLTAVALKFSVAEFLPRVGYLTILDIYVLGCTLFLFLMGVENFTMAFLLKRETYELSALEDDDDLWLTRLLIAWGVFHVGFFAFSFIRTDGCRYRMRKAPSLVEIPAIDPRLLLQ